MENPYVSKVINLLKKEGSLMTQEESSVFLLSVILEDFVSGRESDSRYTKEVAFAKRLYNFLLDDVNLFYYDA